MFQFPGFAALTYVFSQRSPYGGVSPFGNSRIKACSQLPGTYRNVLRPSSPLSAKASTRCPSCACLLSVMPGDRTSVPVLPGSPTAPVTLAKTRPASGITRYVSVFFSHFTMSNSRRITVVTTARPKAALLKAVCGSIHQPVIRQKTGGGERDRTDDLLLAKQALYQLSYTPKGALTGSRVEHGGPG